MDLKEAIDDAVGQVHYHSDKEMAMQKTFILNTLDDVASRKVDIHKATIAIHNVVLETIDRIVEALKSSAPNIPNNSVVKKGNSDGTPQDVGGSLVVENLDDFNVV